MTVCAACSRVQCSSLDLLCAYFIITNKQNIEQIRIQFGKWVYDLMAIVVGCKRTRALVQCA